MNRHFHLLPNAFLATVLFVLLSTIGSAAESSPPGAQQQGKRYNVLFIAVDDLNDWVGCFGGNPQAITPNLDRLAKQQAMVMNKAYAPSTVCCPSRSSLLTGKDEGQWAYHEWADPGGVNQGMLWEESPDAVLGTSGQPELSWGACKAPVEETKDYRASKWAADQLQRDFDGKPFFLALGISKPHLSWVVPQQFFDLYPLEKIQPVEIFRDDLDDIVRKDGKPVFKPGMGFFPAIDKANLHKEAQRAYLANVSYVDYCLGVLFEALQKSKYADNTIIMLWGDHGWHLGEKLKYGKTDLWEESARVPLIVRVPGLTPPGVKCDGVVNLLDMYPTLIELCGLPPNQENEGRSFAPLLKNPKMEWNYPTLTTYQFKNHSLTDGRYRYTWYGGKADGAEELYDHSTDPLEHKNLAANPESKEIIARFKKHLPAHDEPDSPRNGPEDGDTKATRKGGKTKSQGDQP